MSFNNKKQSQNKVKQLNSFAHFSGMGFQMIAIIGLGVYVGIKLDEEFPNKHDLYTVILSLISVILAIVFAIKRIISASKKNNE